MRKSLVFLFSKFDREVAEGIQMESDMMIVDIQIHPFVRLVRSKCKSNGIHVEVKKLFKQQR